MGGSEIGKAARAWGQGAGGSAMETGRTQNLDTLVHCGAVQGRARPQADGRRAGAGSCGRAHTSQRAMCMRLPPLSRWKGFMRTGLSEAWRGCGLVGGRLSSEQGWFGARREAAAAGGARGARPAAREGGGQAAAQQSRTTKVSWHHSSRLVVHHPLLRAAGRRRDGEREGRQRERRAQQGAGGLCAPWRAKPAGSPIGRPDAGLHSPAPRRTCTTRRSRSAGG